MKDQVEKTQNDPQIPKQKQTNVGQLLADLHGGTFEKKLAHTLSQAGLAAIGDGGQAKVQVTFTLKKVATGRECKLEHSIAYVIPTRNGEKSEKDRTETVVYVNEGGNLTILPEAQSSFQFERKGD